MESAEDRRAKGPKASLKAEREREAERGRLGEVMALAPAL